MSDIITISVAGENPARAVQDALQNNTGYNLDKVLFKHDMLTLIFGEENPAAGTPVCVRASEQGQPIEFIPNVFITKLMTVDGVYRRTFMDKVGNHYAILITY